MTIDERLEALAMSGELMMRDLETLRSVVEEDGKQIRALRSTAEEDGKNIRALHSIVGTLHLVVQEDSQNIRALAKIAGIHERRLTDLEGYAGS